jgi:glutamate/tyrosine decarboxylase-like PLP-dependent enzyme
MTPPLYTGRNTIALVASAPQYPHGLMDPVQDIAALGLRLGLPVHVDACLGGQKRAQEFSFVTFFIFKNQYFLYFYDI